jgi:two-component system, LuxR family, response regulator FixJ
MVDNVSMSAGETGTVFVVDDDDGVRQSVLALLRSAGLQARGFPNGEDFLAARMYEQQGCLITDVRLLGMNGLRLLSRVRELGSRMPVIVLTAHADVRIAVEAMHGGALTVLEKPYREQDLWDHVVTALRTDRELRRQQARNETLRERLESLTEKEHQVLQHLARGAPNKVIARALNIAPRTVDLRRQSLLKKMGSANTVHLVRDLAEVGLLNELD